jgi:O-antigen/teichoic acid export membrane protein
MLKKVGSNWLLLVATILATYFLVPFNLGRLGKEQYGLWLLISSITAYLSLLQLGVPMASVRHLTKAIAEGDQLAVNRLVASCAGLYLGLGAVSALVGVPLLVFYENAYSIPPELQTASRWAFLLALANVGLGFFAQLPYAIMNSYQDFVRTNLLSTLMVLARAGLNVVLVWWYPSLVALAAVMVAVTVAEMVILWILILVSHREIRPAPRLFSVAVVRQVVGFSVYVLLLSMGAQLSFQTDAIVIGRCLEPEKIPFFSVGNNLILYLMQFIVGIASVMMPLATSLQAQGKMDELRAVFLKWSKLAVALTWCAGLYLVVYGPDFLANWVGIDFKGPSGSVLRILMLSYFLFLPLRGVGLPVLMGMGNAARPTVAFLAAGVLNLVLSLILVWPLGLDGVAWGTTIPNVLLAATLLYLACEALEIPVLSYLANVLPRAVIGFGLTFLVLWGLRSVWEPRTFVELAAAGVVTVAVFGLVWWGFVFRNDPHVILPQFARLLARRVP